MRIQDFRGAVILAGGGSRRMERPKAWIEVDGTPLLARIVDVVRDVCPNVVVVGVKGMTLPELAADVMRVDDPQAQSGQGPLVGMHAGLQALDGLGMQLAYISSCDQVLLTSEHVRFVVRRLETNMAVDAVVPKTPAGEDSYEPFLSAVRAAPAARVAERLLDAGERRARRLFPNLRCERVAPASLPDARVLQPCNTPKDLDAAVAQLQSA